MNPNHPLKGSQTCVEPIRSETAIASIKKVLATRPRDLLLFTLAINNGIRTGDLLRLKVSDVQDLNSGGALTIVESKTGKKNTLVINKGVHRALKLFLSSEDVHPDHFLFRSRKGQNRPISVQYVNHMVKCWCKAINLSGNYGAHSLRKTFGYIQRTKYGVGFEVLCKRFNHSSPQVTMRYLGISDSEVMLILQNDV